MIKRQRHTPSAKSAGPSSAHSALSVAVDEPGANTPNSGVREPIPPQWVWHYRTLVRLRDRLLPAHAEHARQAATPPDMLGGDVADMAQEQTDRDVLWAELGNESDRLFEVDCALQRIRDGTYGFCEKTGCPIPPERLRAIPWTRYSFTAAQPLDQRASGAKKSRL